MIENSNEALDLRQYPAFQRQESYETFVKDMIETHKQIVSGKMKMYSEEEIEDFLQGLFNGEDV